MTWEALGAIAETLGAIGVIGTLVYLSLQVRQSKEATRENTRTISMQSGREIDFAFSEWHREIARDLVLLEVFRKSTQVPMADYTDEEWNQFNLLAKGFFHLAQAQYINQTMGLGINEQDEGYLRAVRTLLATWPAWRKFWDEETRTNFWPPGFIAELARDDVGSIEGLRTTGGPRAP